MPGYVSSFTRKPGEAAWAGSIAKKRLRLAAICGFHASSALCKSVLSLILIITPRPYGPDPKPYSETYSWSSNKAPKTSVGILTPSCDAKEEKLYRFWPEAAC